jgi:Asp-tRNA(Asn)/Glu-tRNA(Gln) amidotransferase A subunit family amidase
MAENGPIATTVEDVALMLAALAERAEFRDPQPPERPLCIAV